MPPPMACKSRPVMQSKKPAPYVLGAPLPMRICLGEPKEHHPCTYGTLSKHRSFSLVSSHLSHAPHGLVPHGRALNGRRTARFTIYIYIYFQICFCCFCVCCFFDFVEFLPLVGAFAFVSFVFCIFLNVFLAFAMLPLFFLFGSPRGGGAPSPQLRSRIPAP